ncbi:hypothetical protein CEXT_85441 [Caerostris extrusa]|uniref:Uncharacterized protein n=1 Tax=Caerostris extrusa TaxID=172846 RepID=A0AAV4USB6_CAEEX|nr:hypothetical protein CEXT_85441 [Caerostris extrusa]
MINDISTCKEYRSNTNLETSFDKRGLEDVKGPFENKASLGKSGMGTIELQTGNPLQLGSSIGNEPLKAIHKTELGWHHVSLRSNRTTLGLPNYG